MSRHRFPNGSEETSQHGVTQQPQRSNVRLYSNSLWRFGYFDIFKAVSLPGSFWTTQEQFGVCVGAGGTIGRRTGLGTLFCTDQSGHKRETKWKHLMLMCAFTTKTLLQLWHSSQPGAKRRAVTEWGGSVLHNDMNAVLGD